MSDTMSNIEGQAFAELGQDRVNAGETPESYINKMSLYEYTEFLVRAGVIYSEETSHE